MSEWSRTAISDDDLNSSPLPLYSAPLTRQNGSDEVDHIGPDNQKLHYTCAYIDRTATRNYGRGNLFTYNV